MGLYTALVSGLLFPFHELLKHHDTRKVRRALERSQWWEPEELERLRLSRLKRLLSAAQASPYYREVFQRCGLEPLGLRSLYELEALPFLTKKLIRSNLERIKTGAHDGLSLFNTGGSTGEPLQFYLGRERVGHDVAAKWRATRWWGVDIGDREIVLWGSPIELSAQDRVRAVRDRVLRTKLLPAFEMSQQKLDGFIAEIEKFRPRMLFGYPSAIALIARRAASLEKDLTRVGVDVAFVTAEQLFDDQRRLIEDCFDCRVANGYGGRDLGFAAHECPEGSLHITAEDILIEIVDGQGRVLPAGEEGEVVVTNLATSEYPFIRYRTGDVASLSSDSCACGRGLPLLDSVRGRTTDFVVAADGTVMHALALIYPIREVRGVENFKIVQEDRLRTRVYLVTEDDMPESSMTEISRRLRERLGENVDVSLERVDHIPRSRSGKHRYVESRVPVTAHGA